MHFSPVRRGSRPAWVALLAALAALIPTPVVASDALRVGVSGDYAPFSALDGEEYDGFDAAVARAYAADRGLALEWVRFRWPTLLDDLAADRFDIAMSGVTVRPERSAVGRFSVPVAETGAVVLVRDAERWDSLADLDRSRVRIAVNAGGHLERVARARFRHATLIAIPENAGVPRALRDEAVDAVVTDSAEAALWEAETPGLLRLGPFTHDRKAYLVGSVRPELAADLDDWLLERERDGTLARLREAHLGTATARTAEPLAALLAAVDERLSLMPLVSVVKRRSGIPIEVPEREEQVLDAAAAAALEAAHRADVRPPSFLDLRRFFRAQLEAAKQIQWRAVNDHAYRPASPLPDLDTALRPALLRIGDRIARLVVVLPAGLSRETVREAANDALRAPYLTNGARREIADALAELAPPASARRSNAEPN